MTVPEQPKLYHIVHVDRLRSIVADGQLWCDREVLNRASQGGAVGTTIGMSRIKQRRMNDLRLTSYPGLFVGDCVPFYFCPRSVMLYLIDRGNDPDLTYHGGQEPILHLEADLHAVVRWAQEQTVRWVFTLSNAGATYFEDRCDLSQIGEINWTAVHARDWRASKEGKQAEFLLERACPWHLIERIGVKSAKTYQLAMSALPARGHRPPIELRPEWYY